MGVSSISAKIHGSGLAASTRKKPGTSRKLRFAIEGRHRDRLIISLSDNADRWIRP
jgi:hypothetical protein